MGPSKTAIIAMDSPPFHVTLETSDRPDAGRLDLRDFLSVLEEDGRELIWEVVDWEPMGVDERIRPLVQAISAQYDSGNPVFLSWEDLKAIADGVSCFTDSCFAGWSSRTEAEVPLPCGPEWWLQLYKRARLVIEDYGRWAVVTHSYEVLAKLLRAFPKAEVRSVTELFPGQ
ncbi:MAG: hypothetical protein K6T17_00875 [Fimbriimonadales bacterium]|nr:hypothetical protein [Fimbriimonadales bacterium]